MAIPFNVPRQEISGDATNAQNAENAVDTARMAAYHYLRIENLLMELLSMLRWTPWATMYGKHHYIFFSVYLLPVPSV